jgi:hypothetical protein
MNISIRCFIFLALGFGTYAALPLRVPAQSSKYATVTQSQAFSRAYSARYSNLQALSSDVILIELTECLEDILVSGSHVSTVVPDYKIRQIERNLFMSLQEHVCGGRQGIAMAAGLKTAAASDLILMSEREQWQVTDAQFGKLSATLVRFIESATLSTFCKSGGLDQFAR